MLLNVFVGLFVPPQVMLLVNRALMPLKTNIVFLNVPLKLLSPQAFSAQNAMGNVTIR